MAYAVSLHPDVPQDLEDIADLIEQFAGAEIAARKLAEIRNALVKLAERTVIIRALKDDDEERRKKVAREVFDIYAPLAHRLGVGQLKWELEDLSFRYLQPGAYGA